MPVGDSLGLMHLSSGRCSLVAIIGRETIGRFFVQALRQSKYLDHRQPLGQYT